MHTNMYECKICWDLQYFYEILHITAYFTYFTVTCTQFEPHFKVCLLFSIFLSKGLLNAFYFSYLTNSHVHIVHLFSSFWEKKSNQKKNYMSTLCTQFLKKTRKNISTLSTCFSTFFKKKYMSTLSTCLTFLGKKKKENSDHKIYVHIVHAFFFLKKLENIH
jgi:hypothetical protein